MPVGTSDYKEYIIEYICIYCYIIRRIVLYLVSLYLLKTADSSSRKLVFKFILLI